MMIIPKNLPRVWEEVLKQAITYFIVVVIIIFIYFIFFLSSIPFLLCAVRG